MYKFNRIYKMIMQQNEFTTQNEKDKTYIELIQKEILSGKRQNTILMKRQNGFLETSNTSEKYISHGNAIISNNINIEQALNEIKIIFKQKFGYSTIFSFNGKNWSIIGKNYDDLVYNFPKTLSNGIEIIWSTYDVKYTEKQQQEEELNQPEEIE